MPENMGAPRYPLASVQTKFGRDLGFWVGAQSSTCNLA